MKILIFGGNSDIAKAVKGATLISRDLCSVLEEGRIDKFISKFKPDVVVNCAGISHVGLVKNQSSPLWLRQIMVNLVGSYFIAKACAKQGIPVILIASVAGKYGKAEHSAYCASKCGIISLVQSLAMEGHKAYCISPGRVDTRMRERDYPGEDKRTRLTTKQVADVILDCVKGKYKSGDNIIIRKIGYKTFKKIDRGFPWKKYLNVQPYGTPKII